MAKTPDQRAPGPKRVRTRARLIEATHQLVEERGFSAVTLDEIAARAGVTKGAIYGNFESKEALLVAMVQARGASIGAFLTPGAPLSRQMSNLGRAFLEMTKGYGAADAAMTAEFHRFTLSSPEMTERMGRIAVERWTERDAQLSAETADPPSGLRPAEFSAVAQAVAVGLMYQRALTPGVIRDQTVLAVFEALARLGASAATEASDGAS